MNHLQEPYPSSQRQPVRWVCFPSQQTDFETLAQTLSSRKALEMREDLNEINRNATQWWIKREFYCFPLLQLKIIPEAKFSSPLLRLFYKSSEGLWSILVVRRLNKCNSLISFCVESELRAIHCACWTVVLREGVIGRNWKGINLVQVFGKNLLCRINQAAK